MATRTALQVLYETCNTDVLSRISDADIRFGWREIPRAIKVPATIVWVPGDESGGFGKELPPLKGPITTGENQTARNLADLDEFFHVMIMGFDPTNPKSEYAQYGCTRLLYDLWRGCLYRACHGPVSVGQVNLDAARWLTEQSEARHGAALVITGRVRSPIPDDGYTWVKPVTANVDLSLINTHKSSFEVTQ